MYFPAESLIYLIMLLTYDRELEMQVRNNAIDRYLIVFKDK
jgi:hypothetical protein